MTISYSLAPNPKWYIADLVGRPLGAGSMYTYSNLNKTQLKPVYEDPAGTIPWPDPLLFDENGSQGPFYFKFDTLNPEDTYYIEIYDKDGVLQWTIADFSPPTGGGGSVVTEGLSLVNLVTNNVFWRNIGVGPTAITTETTMLAPGAHSALALTASNAGPDIFLIKNNTAATDSVSFKKFILGTHPLTGDVTPVDYLNYACTNSPAGETFKYIQIPITHGIQNLSNTDVVITIWARGNTGTKTLELQWFQFYGDGVESPTGATSVIEVINLTTSWAQYVVTTTVPDVSTATLGACGNDALFLQIQYPLGAACDIDFTKPSLYVGNIAPDEEYQTYDMIDGVVNAPRTGDIRMGINTVYPPFGWIGMNDGTIGSASSNATNRANIDTFPLFNLLWELNSTYVPMYTSAGAPAARGGSSSADFIANNQISLTSMLGRVLMGTADNIPASQLYTVNTGVSTTNITLSNMDAQTYSPSTPVYLTNSGGGAPAGLSLSPQIYYPIIISATVIQLSLTPFGAPVTFSTNGSGSNFIQSYNAAAGFTQGEYTHTLTIPEMPAHTHTLAGGAFIRGGAANNEYANGAFGGQVAATNSTGGGLPHNNIQPSVSINLLMKL